jgi:hypothetical protein
MEFDSAKDLRRWAANIETALGITLSCSENGAFVLRTKAGAMVGVEAAPKLRALVLTGQIGTADETMSVRRLRALLALNIAAGLSGTGCLGLAPENNALLLRLTWSPVDAAWDEDAFTATLIAFAEHVDALSTVLTNGEIETILDVHQGHPPTADRAVDTAQLA